MTQQGQTDPSTWAPKLDSTDNGGDGRRDSSDISAPSAIAGEAGRVNGQAHPTGQPQAGDEGDSPFRLTAKDGATDGSSVGNTGPAGETAPLVVKTEATPANGNAADDAKPFDNEQAEAGPGPSSMLNATKRAGGVLIPDNLKRRKLNGAGYSEIEQLTYFAKEAE